MRVSRVRLTCAGMRLLLLLLHALLAWPQGGNSISTVIMRGGHAPPAWEPNVDITLYRCRNDLQCRAGSYCHAPSRDLVQTRCRSCRPIGRRCRRDAMCCPGNRCSKRMCVPDLHSFLSQDLNQDLELLSKHKGWRRRGRMEASSGKGQVGDPCLRSSDCGPALCCARHFWTRICKPMLAEGQVCTRQRRKGHHGLELFQRCSCADALTCQTLRDTGNPSTYRHSPPHTHILSSSSSALQKRLHVCQTAKGAEDPSVVRA